MTPGSCPDRPAGRIAGVSAPTIWTIGHWTCPRDVFLQPLDEAGIELVADVRSLPGSRRSPQFDREQMPTWLADDGIDYVHLAELGGRRRKQPVDPALNAGWENASFRNYADYTLSDEYRAGIDRLTGLARERRVAILCGEPMPWRCHRSVIANTLTAAGWQVWHLLTDGRPRLHEFGQWGATPDVADDGRITYPRVSPS